MTTYYEKLYSQIVDLFREGVSREDIAKRLHITVEWVDKVLRNAVQPGGE